MRTNELILYKDMEDGELLQDMTFLMENYNNEYYNEDDMKSLLYSTIGDMFPKSTVATITGIGAMAGGIGSFLINKGSGMLFTYAEGQGSAFSFMGFDGKPGAYMIVFCICSVAYLVGWCIMKALVPKYKPIVVE